MTQEEISTRVGKSRSAIANSLRLLDLPEHILSLVSRGSLSAGHARTLLGVKRAEDMTALADRAAETGMSVRELEEAVKRINRRKNDADEEKHLPVLDYYKDLERKLMENTGRRVRLSGKTGKKTLTFYYEDNDDLQDLLEMICGKDFVDNL